MKNEDIMLGQVGTYKASLKVGASSAWTTLFME
jgi:hypothetical protein